MYDLLCELLCRTDRDGARFIVHRAKINFGEMEMSNGPFDECIKFPFDSDS